MIQKLTSIINRHFIGKEEVVRHLLTCLLAGGHVLLEDIPGVGKTTLTKTLAKATDCQFGRVQFTPDTLPGDILGISIYNSESKQFEYREGPIMNQIILADEINRTSPKTQASLLEAMAEQQVTVDGTVYELPKPFMVIATQNPVEFLGTYPLPEAQMDRFMMKLSIGYPSAENEVQMIQNILNNVVLDQAEAVCTSEQIIELQKEVEQIHVSDAIVRYIQDIIRLTRAEDNFVLGASPRAFIHLVKASQAHAFLLGRDYVKPDDVKAVAVPVLHHRMQLTSDAKIRKEQVDKILAGLVIQGKLPLE